jgi:hypothetical protein
MEGRDLRSRLNSLNRAGERLFGWYQRGKMAALDVARALHYLHSHSLTHFVSGLGLRESKGVSGLHLKLLKGLCALLHCNARVALPPEVRMRGGGGRPRSGRACSARGEFEKKELGRCQTLLCLCTRLCCVYAPDSAVFMHQALLCLCRI